MFLLAENNISQRGAIYAAGRGRNCWIVKPLRCRILCIHTNIYLEFLCQPEASSSRQQRKKWKIMLSNLSICASAIASELRSGTKSKNIYFHDNAMRGGEEKKFLCCHGWWHLPPRRIIHAWSELANGFCVVSHKKSTRVGTTKGSIKRRVMAVDKHTPES